MLLVYLSGLWTLEEKDPNTGKLFSVGGFSVQINHIPGTEKCVHYAGKQQN